MAEETKRSNDSWIGIVVWLTILGVAAFVYFRPDSADVFLDVVADKGVSARGAVIYYGTPVREGKVYLAVHEARTQRYLASTVVAIGQDGTFGTGAAPLEVPAEALEEPLRVAATFAGRVVSGKDKQDKDEYKSISGASTVYLGFSPPLLGRAALWVTVAATIVLTGGLLVLFTGALTPSQARLLFFSTYIMTFVSVAAPIALTLVLSQNDYLVSLMQAAPIGVVKGKAKGIAEPQWLLNLGGEVRELRPGSAAAPGPAAAPAAPAVSTGPRGSAGDERSWTSTRPPVEVGGGLAVPFYVVFLAMLGAGINMTIQVPRIQVSYTTAAGPGPSSLFAATARLFMAMLGAGSPEPTIDVGTMARIRRELIDNYMYVLSAPIIAIAVYYLLQVVGASTSEPVLVLMAFATGFTSDKIVARIIDFAETRLATEEQKKRKADEDKRADEADRRRAAVEQAKAEAEKARAEADRATAEMEKVKAEAEKARLTVLAASAGQPVPGPGAGGDAAGVASGSPNGVGDGRGLRS